MFWKIAKFEFTYFIKQPSFYIISLLFFLLAFGAVSSIVHFGASNANVNYNSPYAVSKLLVVFSFIAMFLVANFVGMSATRDFNHKMNAMIYAMPIHKGSYLWGRLFGVLLFSLFVFSFVSLGALIASFMPWLNADRLGETYFLNYISTYFIFVLPNFIFVASLFYAFALLTRSMMGMYLGVVGFFILKAISRRLLDNPSLEKWASLLDPFGNHAFSQVTKYWTAHDMNTISIGLEDLIWQNRLLWLLVSLILVILTHFIIDIRKIQKFRVVKNKSKSEAEYKDILSINTNNSTSSQWLRFRTRFQFEILQIIKSPAFIVLTLFTLFTLSRIFMGGGFQEATWPITQNMVYYIIGSFSFLILIIITYYGAESIWREKDIGIGEVVDSTPSSNWALFFPKLFAIYFIVISLLVIGVIFAIAYQTYKGYMLFEWDVYFILLFVLYVIPTFMMTVLSLFFQTISPNKYVGMLLFALFVILSAFLSQLGIEHNMWNFTSLPNDIFSDMNRFGHFVKPMFIYNIYWIGLTFVLVILSYGLKNRGTEYSFKYRLVQFKINIGKTGLIAISLASLLFVTMGSYIYYNTTVLNTFYSSDNTLDLKERYEKKYAKFESLALAKITDVNVSVDIYPKIRKVKASGYYIIKNKNHHDINKTLIHWDEKSKVNIKMLNTELKDFDKRFYTAWLHFTPPLKANESRKLSFNVLKEFHGFVDKASDTSMLENGTFINNANLFPRFGYNSRFEIADKHERKKRGLPPIKKVEKLEDSSQHKFNFLGKDADFIHYEALISTNKEQFAITPGYLQKKWVENDRRYFHYKMDAPILNFFAFQSALYEVKKVAYNDVSIEIYYHKPHDKNIQTMIDAVKLSLDVFETEFSPYQHKQVRIIEFPRYRSFAQSFANTIPYAESMGFISDLRDKDKPDMVTFITAHEMAHQWWGHQLMPANVQGSEVLTESLAEYSAYLVLEKLHGKHSLRKYLKKEMDRYLQGRKRENTGETALYKSKNKAYIHYFKGGVVMYALSDRLGKKTFNLALKNFLNAFKYKSNPYPTTLDLIQHIKAIAQKSDHGFIDDMFKKITLFDLKMKSAKAKKLATGNYRIELTIQAEKFYADKNGKETKAKLDDYFDIGIFSSDPDKVKSDAHVLKFDKERIKSGENIFVFEVKKLPKFAGIDPYIKMIDRDSNDNLISVELLD